MLHPVQAVLRRHDRARLRPHRRGGFDRRVCGRRRTCRPTPRPSTPWSGLMRSMALETAGSGVTVNAVCPGYVDTDLIRGPLDRLVERGTSQEEALARFTSRVPIGRLVRPEEVAEAVLYFCSPARGRDHRRHSRDRSGRRMMDERTSIPLDAETKVAERPDDHKTELRLWLRLLTCTTLIENEVRRRLRDQFDITLPRFDLLAQLDRAPNGMTLGELSQRMMVSNGNITGLVDRLAEQGLIRRKPLPTRPPRADRQPHARGAEVLPQHGAGQRRLGRRDFRRACRRSDIEALMPLLAKTKQSARKALRERRRVMSAANPVTLPLSGYQGAARRLRRGRQGRDADAEPAGQEKPADLRQLRRDRRHLPRRGEGQGRQGHRRHRRRRQLLLRRRRVRDHRAAHQDEHGGAARLHPDDRRRGEIHARLPAADHRGDRRRLRRRRRDHRHGLRHPHRHRGGEGRVPVQPRRPRRLRHGRLRDPAAHHRPGPRGRAAVHRPQHGRRGGRAHGLLQPARQIRDRAGRRAEARARSRQRARPSATP